MQDEEGKDAGASEKPEPKEPPPLEIPAGKLYRILDRPLNAGKHGLLGAGSLTQLEWLDERQLGKLLELEIVSEVAPPPLKILPKWKQRAKRLATAGIVDAVQLLLADSAEVAERVGLKAEMIDRYKDSVREWLTVKPTHPG